MAEAITIFIAGSFQHDTTSVLKISIAGGALQTVTVPIGWYRVWLASTGGGGTAHTDPFEYLAKLKALLDAASPGNNWTVRMGSSGLVQLTYTGATYAITWDGTSGTDKKARNVLGFTANIGTTSSGIYSTASAGPMFCVSSIGRERDSDWNTEQTHASKATEGGVVYSIRSGVVRAVRSFDVTLVPTDTGALTSLGLATAYSPAFPDPSRFTSPLAVPTVTLDYVYSWHDFLHTMDGRELGAVIGTRDGANLTNFPTVQAGTSTKYDKCYLHEETVARVASTPTQYGWHDRRTLRDLKFRFGSQASL